MSNWGPIFVLAVMVGAVVGGYFGHVTLGYEVRPLKYLDTGEQIDQINPHGMILGGLIGGIVGGILSVFLVVSVGEYKIHRLERKKKTLVEAK